MRYAHAFTCVALFWGFCEMSEHPLNVSLLEARVDMIETQVLLNSLTAKRRINQIESSVKRLKAGEKGAQVHAAGDTTDILKRLDALEQYLQSDEKITGQKLEEKMVMFTKGFAQEKEERMMIVTRQDFLADEMHKKWRTLLKQHQIGQESCQLGQLQLGEEIQGLQKQVEKEKESIEAALESQQKDFWELQEQRKVFLYEYERTIASIQNQCSAKLEETIRQFNKTILALRNDVQRVLHSLGKVMCDPGWLQLNGTLTCYMLVTNQNQSWHKAQEFCKSKGAKLAEPKTQDIMKSILILVGDNNPWLGGGDMDEEGVWKWIDSNEEMTYSAWAEGQPNSYKGKEQDCMNVFFGDGWNDEQCSIELAFLCEKQQQNS